MIGDGNMTALCRHCDGAAGRVAAVVEDLRRAGVGDRAIVLALLDAAADLTGRGAPVDGRDRGGCPEGDRFRVPSILGPGGGVTP